jgi:DNA (cytosine-5)-methyltransferase 1
MSLGFEQAGFDVAAAVEIDPIHACIHSYNFPDCAMLVRSVTGLSGTDIRKAAKLNGRRIDTVFGGAPCQGFSLIGHRALDDPRNALVREFVRLVVELEARYFVFENVKGLTVGEHVGFLNELVDAFHAENYTVLVPWRVLNAVNYGVPQSRERLFLIGMREGERLPSYPSPTTRAPGTRYDLFGLAEAPTCRDALGDLPNPEGFDSLIVDDTAVIERWGQPSSYSLELRAQTASSWHFGYRRLWDPSLLTSSMRTGHTHISRRRFLQTQPGEMEPISRFYKLPPDGVSNTLRAGTDSARGAFTSPRPIHYEQPRCVTVREMARLHGFPDWFRFNKTKWHGARQIGNAVPPPLARSVAAAIIAALGIIPAQPVGVLQLGDPTLLALDMSRAARFWNVEAPIGKRDRKSGARKRKQIDIERSRVEIAREAADGR